MPTTAQSTQLTASVTWSLIELRIALMFMRSLFQSGLSTDQVLDEIAALQPKKAQFWLTAAKHCRAGKPLHDYLRGRWPDALVSPIQIAETSGRLDDVLAGMENSLLQQIETQKLLKKLLYPISTAIGGISAAVFFIAHVIPSMVGKMRFEREPAIITFTKQAQVMLQDYGPTALALLAGLAALIAYQWHQSPQFRAQLIGQVNRLPYFGWTTRWLWYSVWANYAAIMIKADIAITDKSFRTTLSTLPEHLRESIALTLTQLERGQTMTQASTPNQNADDPRQWLPIHIKNAFRMTDRTGNGAKQFQIASQTLFEPGKEMLSSAITNLNYIIMVISAAMVVIPFGLYLKTISGLVSSVGR